MSQPGKNQNPDEDNEERKMAISSTVGCLVVVGIMFTAFIVIMIITYLKGLGTEG